jgi:hypothetical protein
MAITPDARRINHMDPETKAVHARLESWGRWAKEKGVSGWPERTLLGRLIDGEELVGAAQSKPPIAMPDDVAVTDRAVAHLGVIDRRVIETYYLQWEPVEVMARRNSMRVRQFQNVLRRARWRISGFLGAIV